MKTKVSPAVVGMFVMGALVLGLIALFSFGGVNIFSKPQRFVVYFDETVHGLDLGSPVKLRGVRIGRVAGISLRYRADTTQSVVAVVCELSRDVILDEKGAPIDVSDPAELQRMVDRGLRAQLGILGLATGLLYVELDFFDPGSTPANGDMPADGQYTLVPAAPSTISQFQASFSEILSDLNQVNFTGLAGDIRALLADTRRQINTFDLQPLIAEWTSAGTAVTTFVQSPELGSTLTNLNAAATELRTVLARIDGQIDPTAESLAGTLADARESLEAFNRVAVTLRGFINSQQNLGDSASQALSRLAEAAAAIERLADYLERNPGALLTGRRPPP